MIPQAPLRVVLPPTTLSKSYLPNDYAQSTPSAATLMAEASHHDAVRIARATDLGSTAKGIMIGIFSVLGAAGVCLIITSIVYYFRYTQQGRIFLDRLSRPGEYDDEQQFAKEEAEALENMDDLQRMEYMRAKGTSQCTRTGSDALVVWQGPWLTNRSFCTGKPSRIRSDRHLLIAVLGNTREGRFRMGIRTGAGDCELFCRRPDRDRVLRLRVQRTEQLTNTETKRRLLLGSQGVR